jgi:hypothetical protein
MNTTRTAMNEHRFNDAVQAEPIVLGASGTARGRTPI